MLDALKKKLAEKAEAVIDHIKLSEDKRNERFDICKSCDKLGKGDFCKLCGCYMPVKTYMPHQHCPIYKWDVVDIDKKD